MGQTSGANLAALLLLGEPEAVVAVAHAARAHRRAGAARLVGHADHGDRPLHAGAGRSGPGHDGPGAGGLPGGAHAVRGETPDANLETIRLVLSRGPGRRRHPGELWAKARRQPYHYIGFLEFLPDELPEDVPARDDHASIARIGRSRPTGNPFAVLLSRCFSAAARPFSRRRQKCWRSPSPTTSCTHLFDVIGDYFERCARAMLSRSDVDAMAAAAESRGGLDETQRGDADVLIVALPQSRRRNCEPCALLGSLSSAVEPVLTRTTAVGPLMRRKLEAVVAPIVRATRRSCATQNAACAKISPTTTGRNREDLRRPGNQPDAGALRADLRHASRPQALSGKLRARQDARRPRLRRRRRQPTCIRPWCSVRPSHPKAFRMYYLVRWLD